VARDIEQKTACKFGADTAIIVAVVLDSSYARKYHHDCDGRSQGNGRVHSLSLQRLRQSRQHLRLLQTQCATCAQVPCTCCKSWKRYWLCGGRTLPSMQLKQVCASCALGHRIPLSLLMFDKECQRAGRHSKQRHECALCSLRCKTRKTSSCMKYIRPS
jgi:hypothetical protein